MNDPAKRHSGPAIFIDMGTTTTRVWLARGTEILGRRQAQVGVRDTARDGSPARLHETLRALIASLCEQCDADARPTCVIAAGMITSSLGLAEVPHLHAPAGLNQLAAAARRLEFPEITPLPIFLIPGVRSGSTDPVCDVDLMRGEETLCLGLLQQRLISTPSAVVNLGSHWKVIQIDQRGRIAGSITTLSGEMIHAVATTTILASALPAEVPDSLEWEFLNAGMAEQYRSGLPRALFCVRLLELAKATTPQQRFAFLAGAFIACDLDEHLTRGTITPNTRIAIVGNAAIAGGWEAALIDAGLQGICITEQQTEAAMLAGLGAILELLELG